LKLSFRGGGASRTPAAWRSSRLEGPPRADRRALPKVVVIPAGVLLHHALAFEGDRARHDVVEKRPVVTDQEDRSRVVGQELFEEFERLRVEIVGRLVQDEHVRGSGEQSARRSRFRSPPDRTPTPVSPGRPEKRKSCR
jgi:hypothetical protein